VLTGRAGIDKFTPVIRAARSKNWKILSGLLEICTPNFALVDDSNQTFWDIIDWRALVTVHADNMHVNAFLKILRDEKVVSEHITRLIENATTYTSENYLRAAREANWSYMSTCLDEYFPLFESVDSDGKSAAMHIIDSGTRQHLSLLAGRDALFAVAGTTPRTNILKTLCIYAADTMKVDSIRILIELGGDDLLHKLVVHFTTYGGLKMMQWLMKNYEESILHVVSAQDKNILVLAFSENQLNIVEWLMDTYRFTTDRDSPLHYALVTNDPPFFAARWLFKTGRVSNTDLQTKFVTSIEDEEFETSTFLIEIGKANIDVDFLWEAVDWSKLATNRSMGAKLFLRALLPRVDFPSHISRILKDTSYRGVDGSEIFIHRQMVLDGVVVRKKVVKFHESRSRIVKQLNLPDDLIDSVLEEYVGNNQTTDEMWNSIRY
jgi:hypothetical protein